MRYFELYEPYYSLLKAEDEKKAITRYTEIVANNSSDCPLENEIKEVSRDYALAMSSRALGEDGNTIPINEFLEEFNEEESNILLISRDLAL